MCWLNDFILSHLNQLHLFCSTYPVTRTASCPSTLTATVLLSYSLLRLFPVSTNSCSWCDWSHISGIPAVLSARQFQWKMCSALQMIEEQWLPGMCQFGSRSAERKSWEFCSGARLPQSRTVSPFWNACSITDHYPVKIHIFLPVTQIHLHENWFISCDEWDGFFQSDFSVPGIHNSGHYWWITCQRGSSPLQQVAFPARSKHWQKCLLSIDRCINELAEVSPYLA